MRYRLPHLAAGTIANMTPCYHYKVLVCVLALLRLRKPTLLTILSGFTPASALLSRRGKKTHLTCVVL